MKRLIGTAAAALMIIGFGAGTAQADTVNATALNVRTGPSTGYRVIAVLTKGTSVTRVSTSGSWAKISSPKSGWVYAAYLTRTSSTSTKYVNASALNVRSGPSTGYRVLATLSRNTKVVVDRSSGSWKHITSPKVGWVLGTYLSSSQSGSTSTSTSSYNVGGVFYGTAYKYGRAYRIALVRIDGKPVAQKSASPFLQMRAAAQRAGVYIRVVSGFRTMAEQQYLYRLYGSPRAARPGYSNHQSGTAFDVNTTGFGGSVYNWLTRNAWRYGFKRTVSFESWHWEYMR